MISFTGAKLGLIVSMVAALENQGEPPTDFFGDEQPDALMLVYDHGVYLMLGGEDKAGNLMHTPGDQIYADGLDPNTDEDWYDAKIEYVGGDDGVEYIPASIFRQLFALVGDDLDAITVNMSPEDFYVSYRRKSGQYAQDHVEMQGAA